MLKEYKWYFSDDCMSASIVESLFCLWFNFY